MNLIIVPLCAALGAALLRALWENFKASEEQKPLRVRYRKGRYETYSLVARLQRIGTIACYVWLAYMAALLVALATMKLT